MMEFKRRKHGGRPAAAATCFTSPTKVLLHLSCLSWLSISFINLLLLTQFAYAADQIKIGGLFEVRDTNVEIAFRQAIEAVNHDNYLLPNTVLTPQIRYVQQPHTIHKKVCSILASGVGAIFGPQKAGTSVHVQSICDALEVPHFKISSEITRDITDVASYSHNLYPHPSTLAKAFKEVLNSLGWKKFCIIYENNNGLIRIQELIKDEKFSVSLKQLPFSDDYRPILKEAREEGVTHIVLDIETKNIFTVLKQAQQVGIMTSYHNYFITSLDLHTVDLEDFRHGGTNLYTLQLVDLHSPAVQRVIQDWTFEEDPPIGRTNQIQTEVALMYDAVKVFATALGQHMHSMNINTTALKCDGDAAWEYGTSLSNFIRMGSLYGLTGLITFDFEGVRSSVNLDMVQLTQDGLKSIGKWDQLDGINLTQTDMDVEADIMDNLQNQTLVVMATLSDPYVMMVDEPSEHLMGNDRYEGFCIDLMRELSEMIGFKYTIVLSPDGKTGGLNAQTNQWTGMIGELVNYRADLAIGDVTITSRREQAVDFSMPWMHTGIAILYKRPRRRPPRDLFYSFFTPLSLEIWIYIATAFIGVSILLFLIARFSPYERMEGSLNLGDSSPKMENQFTLANSFWFVWGSILQQKTDQQPRAVSTRIVAGMWWFFTLILICAYTANMAVYFFKGAGSSSLDFPITNVHDLAAQTMIKYGTVKGGSTSSFFSTSYFPTYQKMFTFMESQFPSVYVNTNEEGMQRVKEDDGAYAFLMESSSIEYITERRCDLIQVGGNLDSKSYGIALPPGSPYLPQINQALLQLQEDGILGRLKKKWWTYMRGGGRCKQRDWSAREKDYYSELGVHNVAGLFILLLAGMGLAIVVAVCEFAWNFWKSRTNTTQ